MLLLIGAIIYMAVNPLCGALLVLAEQHYTLFIPALHTSSYLRPNSCIFRLALIERTPKDVNEKLAKIKKEDFC